MTKVLLALGSNLGDRLHWLRRARRLLEEHPGILLERSSTIFETEPVGGPVGQGRYLNAALAVSTSLTAQELLDWCQTVEARCERVRTTRWGPRSVDIDILFYGDLVVRRPRLTIPHPRLHERRFVLAPLAEIAPDFVHPVLRRSCSELLTRLASPEGEVIPYAKDW